MPLGKHHLLTLNQLHQWVENKQVDGFDFESMARRILEILQKAVQFDSAWVIKVAPASFNIQNIYLHQFSQKAFSKYLDNFYNRAPIPTIRQIKNEGFISKKGSDLIENEIWIESPFYREIIRPLDLHFFLSFVCVNDRQEYIGYLVLWRSPERHDFSTQDCFFLEKASIHSANLLDQIRLSGIDLEKPDVLKLVNKRSNPGVIILEKGNETIFINRKAKDILSIIQSGKAYLSNRDDEKFMQNLYSLKERTLQKISLSKQFSDLTDLSHVFTFRGTNYSCRAIPLEGNPLHEGSVMFLIETVKEESATLPLFNQIFSEFTARERAVANLIRQGLTNKEIASELGIGIHTIKDHIKNIMGKLKTRTRSGIAAKLMTK